MRLGVDLETEILTWLPPKSLMRFRCVQKSWNILFETPIFMKKWQMHVYDNDNDSLMILHETKPYASLLSHNNLIHTKSFYSNHQHVHGIKVESHGSCNGVFCLKCLCRFCKICFHELIMWNPTTREVHCIPPTPSLDEEPSLYGFGADDPLNINFKVVKLQIRYGGKAEVYNLRTKPWITIQNPPHFLVTRERLSNFNTLVNGVYHWITNNPYDYIYNNDANILCFDFHNNQFQQLTGPTFSYEDCFIRRDDVAEIKGSLAYVANVIHRHTIVFCLKIWIMDQSGWNNKYNIDGGPEVTLMRGIWKNGTQLLAGSGGGSLRSYDYEGKGCPMV